MSTNEYNEPWKRTADGIDDRTDPRVIYDSCDKREYLDRIVACVNFCASVPSDDLAKTNLDTLSLLLSNAQKDVAELRKAEAAHATPLLQPTPAVPEAVLSVRQRFVLAAMQGLCADHQPNPPTVRELAENAIAIADATLAKEKETRVC